MKRHSQTIFRVFRPKGLLAWLLLLAGVGVVCTPLGAGGEGFSGCLTGALALLVLVAVPCRAWERWEKLPHVRRGGALAFAGYLVVVTLGNWHELHSFRLWGDFLLPRGDSPFTRIHATGLLAAGYFYRTQRYYMVPDGPSLRTIERVTWGRQMTSQAEAQRRAGQRPSGNP